MLRAVDTSTGAALASRLRLAHTHWTRLRGLLGTRILSQGEGLWIKPCNQVHMIGMRYAVDLVFLGTDQRVVRTVERLAPNRLSPKVAEAASVLELPAGTLAQIGLDPGVRIEFEGEADDTAATRIEAAGALLCNVLLAGFYALFAAAHFAHARRTGQWTTTMPIVVQEALLVFLFLGRRRSISTSPHPLDWAVGIAGTFLPLALRAAADTSPAYWAGIALQMSGLAFAVFGVAFLGRSIGVVAANRGIKTAGPYRLVRHPMYAGYLISYVGYTAVYPTARNILILAATAAALNARAIVEERFLRRVPEYDEYLRKIPWRFVPYLY